MESIIICIKLGVVFLGTLFTWIFGAWDMPIVTLLVFIFLAVFFFFFQAEDGIRDRFT